MITREELEEVIKNKGDLDVEGDEIDQIIAEIDYEGTGTINYS